ncbi:microcin C transport system substrate-binding protein [Desulfobaculum xiamenense]|uniref:Microcin C transport system substrate-binding protein n=1 Tax=Desulfobaculum xiamenense TaxID=995050 RepID=A0A846QLH8_9BACT|nr:extracellular solute-binding protein [Desulfobaculum xiamenense]NJB67900.1 microcin C transport system substrate-binding protein [Desulfobaculum xiamenense]
MTRLSLLLLALVAGITCFPSPLLAERVIVTHALTLSGPPELPADFPHFPYANPNAPKGGTLRQCAIGTFDNMNPFTPKGQLPSGYGLLHDSLTTTSDDEPFTQYCLVAQKIVMAEDRSWVEFHIDPRARFQDGTPITAEDVVFSYEATMRNIGSVMQRFFADITSVKAVDTLRVRYEFTPGTSREIPLQVSRLPIYPRHFWESRDLSRTMLEPIVGSGPYRMVSCKPGQEAVYERCADYWARDLPVRKGFHNFDTIRYEYYRDATVALEAFRAEHYDIREEHSAKRWRTLYTGPAFDAGDIVMERVRHREPLGIQGFFFNTRRPMFQDRRVRRAIVLAFDYEWTNRQLFWNELPRTTSYFTNSDLACSGLPSPEELALLEPFRDSLPPETFTAEHAFPTSDNSGFNRSNILAAADLLREAGFVLKDGTLTDSRTGRALRFQLLTDSASMRRVALPFARNLRKLGIDMSILVADTALFARKGQDFDFDMISSAFGHTLCPGRELRFYWHSDSKNLHGGRNVIGLDDPAVDALVDAIVTAPDRKATVTACRALDRVLLWGEYVVPLGASDVYRIAYRRSLAKPQRTPRHTVQINTWWAAPADASTGDAR